MKCLLKTRRLLRDNSGETMVEVLVAFTLLSIMLVIFSQGLAYASKAEINAMKSREGADQAMNQLQAKLASGERATDYVQIVGTCGDRIKIETYTVNVDGREYTYVYYEAIRTGD